MSDQFGFNDQALNWHANVFACLFDGGELRLRVFYPRGFDTAIQLLVNNGAAFQVALAIAWNDAHSQQFGAAGLGQIECVSDRVGRQNLETVGSYQDTLVHEGESYKRGYQERVLWVRYQTILRINALVSALWFSIAAVYIRVDVFVSSAFLCWR